MTTDAYEYLRSNGPAPMEPMPVDSLTVADRQAGIWKFYGSWSSQQTARPGGPTTMVFYIRETHWPRQVVRAWIHANPTAVEKLPASSLKTVLNRNGSEFEEPIRELVGRAKNGGLE